MRGIPAALVLALAASAWPAAASFGADGPEAQTIAAVRDARPKVAAVSSQSQTGDESGMRYRFSAVCIAENGLFVTVADAIGNAQDIEVRLFDGRTFRAEVVGSDRLTNVAVIRIPASGLPCVSETNSQDIEAGSTVIAVGNPFGLSHSVSTGIVSATGRTIRSRDYVFKGMIQTTAPINPGDAGGFLCDGRGRFVGMITSTFGRAPSFFRVRGLLSRFLKDIGKDPEFFRKILEYFIMKHIAGPGSEGREKTPEQAEFEKKMEEAFEKFRKSLEDDEDETGGPGPGRGGHRRHGGPSGERGGPSQGQESPFGAHGINFVMPAHRVLEIARELVKSGGIVRGSIGASGRPLSSLSPEEAKEFGVTATGPGVFVDRITEGGPAEKAGMRVGDVILRIEGKDIAGIDELVDAVFALKPGSTAAVDALRAGASASFAVQVAEKK